MPDAASIQTYIAQWLKTATNDGITAMFAWGTGRMELRCHNCGMTYVSDIPKDVTTNDHAVQLFVQQHLHKNSQVWYDGNSWKPIESTPGAPDWMTNAKEKDEKFAQKIAKMQFQNNLKLQMNTKPNHPLLIMKPVWNISNPFITNESPAKKDWAMVDGKKIYWVRDKDGKVVGVSDKPNTPPPAKKAPKESEGRKFR